MGRRGDGCLPHTLAYRLQTAILNNSSLSRSQASLIFLRIPSFFFYIRESCFFFFLTKKKKKNDDDNNKKGRGGKMARRAISVVI